MIDGNAAPAPVISGATATFNLGGLANGAHTLGGRLVDAVGKSTPFLLHVTIQPTGTPPGAQAYVEKNTKAGQSTTLDDRRRRDQRDDAGRRVAGHRRGRRATGSSSASTRPACPQASTWPASWRCRRSTT